MSPEPDPAAKLTDEQIDKIAQQTPLPEPLPEPLICGHCLMEINHQSGLRYFGSHVAHKEYECLRLLRAEIERLTAELDWRERAEQLTVALAQAQEAARQLRELAEYPLSDDYLIPRASSDCRRHIRRQLAAIDAAQKKKP